MKMEKDDRGRVSLILCRNGLTPKQQRFVECYTDKTDETTYFNATESAKRAYPNAKTSAYQVGHENLKKPRVTQAIQEALKGTEEDPRLTLKQRKFLKLYIENGGNGTKAALAAYDTADPKTAAVLGSKTLRNVKIRKELEKASVEAGLSREEIIRELRKDIYYSDEPNPVRTKSLELLTKHAELQSTPTKGKYDGPFSLEQNKALLTGTLKWVSGMQRLMDFMPEDKETEFWHIFREHFKPLVRTAIRIDVLDRFEIAEKEGRVDELIEELNLEAETIRRAN